eukprot:scpid101738/ scgid22792/ 
MPRVVFSDDLEKKLIELWAEYQRDKSGKMKKRTVKEREITATINEYARELYGPDVEEFPQSVIHNKIDNLKAKAREHYRKFKVETGTGAAVIDPGCDSAYDLEGAFSNWANFRVWHRCFSDVPGYGPLMSLNTATIASHTPVPVSSSRSTSSPPTPSATSSSGHSSSSPPALSAPSTPVSHQTSRVRAISPASSTASSTGSSSTPIAHARHGARAVVR